MRKTKSPGKIKEGVLDDVFVLQRQIHVLKDVIQSKLFESTNWTMGFKQAVVTIVIFSERLELLVSITKTP